MATLVTWPISVLNANDVIVAMETPFERVLVSKISEQITQVRGPIVALKEKMKAQLAEVLFVASGGNLAIMIVGII